MQAMVLSIIGKDKSGLVEQIADAVAQAEGNWLMSSFCQLGGHFAGFVEIMLPKSNHELLIQRCQAISNLQITLLPASQHSTNDEKHVSLTVTGNDRKGIVNDVAGVLKRFDINIETLATSCESAPNWGNPLFSALITLTSTASFDPDSVKAAIEDIADDLIVDIKS